MKRRWKATTSSSRCAPHRACRRGRDISARRPPETAHRRPTPRAAPPPRGRSKLLRGRVMDVTTLSGKLGIDLAAHAGRDLACRSPIDGAEIAVLRADRAADVQ